MGLLVGDSKFPCRASVWDVTPSEKYTDVKLSVTKKQKDGTWKTEFSGKVRMIGEAHGKAKLLKPADGKPIDRIHLKNIDIQYKWDNESGKARCSFACFDFEWLDKDNNVVNRTAVDTKDAVAKPSDSDAEGGFMNIEESEDLPFQI